MERTKPDPCQRCIEELSLARGQLGPLKAELNDLKSKLKDEHAVNDRLMKELFDARNQLLGYRNELTITTGRLDIETMINLVNQANSELEIINDQTVNKALVIMTKVDALINNLPIGVQGKVRQQVSDFEGAIKSSGPIDVRTRRISEAYTTLIHTLNNLATQ